MITVCFEKRGKSGLCEFLYDSIKSQILDGTLKANEKLPSKRNLSSNLGVSVITVQNAYSQLASEGYIFSIEKKGFFVTDLNISESEAARMLGQAPQSINSKVKRGTLRYIEVQTLLEKLGKTLTVITKQK